MNNEHYPAMSRDGIRTLAFPLVQTVSVFHMSDGTKRPGYWTETYFTTDKEVLPAISKLAALVPDSIIDGTAQAQVSQRRAVRVFGWDRDDQVPSDHSAYLEEGEDFYMAAIRVTAELVLKIRGKRRTGKIEREPGEYLQ